MNVFRFFFNPQNTTKERKTVSSYDKDDVIFLYDNFMSIPSPGCMKKMLKTRNTFWTKITILFD